MGWDEFLLLVSESFMSWFLPDPLACLFLESELPALLPRQVSCLNEEEEGSARRVFKPWEQRSQPTLPRPLRSNLDDPELLIHVP